MDIVSLAKANILNENGDQVPMHTLWKNQTAVLVFLRHFACIACRAHAREIWGHRTRYETKGAKIHFIGNGSPNFIDGFKEELMIQEASIFTDPTLESFRSAGFKRGFLACIGPTAITNALKLKKKHNLPKKYEKGMGDLWQLGGVLAIAPEGRVVFQHFSEVLGDFPPEDDALGIN